jgi:hypothetical protein
MHLSLFFFIYLVAKRERRVVPTLNSLPDVLDLLLYAGDGIELRMICTNGDGTPIDISGEVKAQIRLERLSPDPPVVSFSVDAIDAYQGIIVLSLSGEQTAALSQDDSAKEGKFSGVWDTQWTPSGAQPKTLCQGKVECVIDVTR